MVCVGTVSQFFSHAKATPMIQLVLLPSRCEELSLPFLFLGFSFPLLLCSLFEVPLDLISGHIGSICVVTALGMRKTQVKGEPQFLCKLSSLFDERLMALMYRILFKRSHQPHCGVLITIQLNG